MKAQSIRRLLTLTNVVLVAGVVGAGAWWFVKGRPALADAGKRAVWVKGANDAYQVAANSARKADFWQVYEKDLDEIKRPDLSNEKKVRTAPGVWPYVGPVPPPPKDPKPPETVKVEAPKGLVALGRVIGATVVPPGDPYARSVIHFEFSAGQKRKAHFFVGSSEPIEDRDPKVKSGGIEKTAAPGAPRRPGKYLVEVAWADYYAGTLRIVYDEVGSEPAALPERKEEILPIHMAASGSKAPVLVIAKGQPGEGQPVLVGRTPTAARPGSDAGDASAAPVRIVGVDRDGARHFEFDESTWNALSKRDLEREILNDVKSEDVPGEQGGVRVTGVAAGSVPAQFGIQPGDVLISVAGQRVRNRNDAIEVAKGLPVETTSVAVVIRRDGTERTVIVDPRDPRTKKAAGRVGFDKR